MAEAQVRLLTDPSNVIFAAYHCNKECSTRRTANSLAPAGALQRTCGEVAAAAHICSIMPKIHLPPDPVIAPR